MSREIKFRGIPLRDADDIYEIADYDGTFVYGYYIKNGDGALIVGDQTEELDDVGLSRWFEDVVPETVGQYTGLKDMNGKEIYEGDIVEATIQGCVQDDKYLVKNMWDPHVWTEELDGYYAVSKMEVKGNVHTNPELLEAQHD